MVLHNLLADARQARLADDYGSAISLCNAYLAANPGDPEGESLLGLCELETNKPSGAGKIEGAAAKNPKSHTIQFNLSILKERQGDIRAAVQSATSAATLAPNAFECWAQLGKLLGMAEKYAEALSALEQAERIRPDHPGVQSLLAGAALECGALDKCEASLERLERSAAGADTTRMRAHLARRRGDWIGLRAIAQDWLAAQPKNEEARVALAHALAQQGYFDSAVEVYAPLCGGLRPSAVHASAMGRYLLGGRRLDEAKRWFDRALAADPKSAEAAYGRARLSHFAGDGAETERWCRRAISVEPAHADAIALLAEASKGETAADDLATTETALAAVPAHSRETIALLFAKGDFLHKLKRADEAFDAWTAANEGKVAAARLAGREYRPDAQEEKISRLIEIFSAPAPKSEKAPAKSTPIFIVGMPRSGTTLLEAAISAHPDVDPAGEVPAMPFILDEFLDWTASAEDGGGAPGEKAKEWRKLYEKQAESFGAAGARFFTDKQPSNFMSVGLILRLYPDARILYLRRNPVETGFSIFRRNFTQQWAFSTSLESIAHYYAEHCRISDYWLALEPERVKFVQFEEMVRDFEPTLRDIIGFCGLSWSDRCLNYYQGGRSVITFSAAQVRKAPSLSHLNSTAPYDARLAELKGALSRYGVDLETGARKTAEQAALKGDRHEH